VLKVNFVILEMWTLGLDGMNADYDCIHPIYLDPTAPNQYTLLTSGNVNTWARALFLHTPGVCLIAHPIQLSPHPN
ncbi:hypothetical protein VP01_2518g1, partial [Puccinia sorghi]